jgi:hypothetical protein
MGFLSRKNKFKDTAVVEEAQERHPIVEELEEMEEVVPERSQPESVRPAGPGPARGPPPPTRGRGGCG